MADLESRLRDWLLQTRQGRHCQAVDGAALASATAPQRGGNQDRALLAVLPAGGIAAALADGMGGMVDGAGCAAHAAAAFVAHLAQSPATPAEDALTAAMQKANDAVYAVHNGHGGTTLTGLYAGAEATYMAHAGDSRLYALAADGSAQLSEDDTALAALPADQAARLPAGERAALGAQLRRAVGIAPDLSPTVRRVSGACFLLTSDGLHDFAPAAIAGLSAGEQCRAAAVETLLDAAAAGGTHDDATAVLVTPERTPVPVSQSPRLWDCYGAM